MRLYIATGYGGRAKAAALAELAKQRDHTITYEWWHHVPADFERVEDRREIANREIYAVRDADAVIVILPGGRGTHVELGAALCFSEYVVLVADKVDMLVNGERCAFHDLVDAIVETPEDALRWLETPSR